MLVFVAWPVEELDLWPGPVLGWGASSPSSAVIAAHVGDIWGPANCAREPGLLPLTSAG